MQSPTLNESSNTPTSSLNALEECSEESIHAPGYIQPYGILLTLQTKSLTVLQASENVEPFLGKPANALLGKPLHQIFPDSQVRRIAAILAEGPLEHHNPFELKLERGGAPAGSGNDKQSFKSCLYPTDAGVVLTMEPQDAVPALDPPQFFHRLQAALLNLRNASSVSDLAQALAQTIKSLTEFDQVMVYRFEIDDHGVVIAEAREPQMESFLGLHFPAFDIPLPARKLFYRNWIRVIPDVNGAPVNLVPSLHPLTQTPLDLSATELRGVSPYHVEYLRNMGVGGSMTISLIDSNRLWGLIACHHTQPKLPDYETRRACELLGQFASVELVHRQEQELNLYRMQVKAIQDKLHQALLPNPNGLGQVLTQNAAQLLNLLEARGAAIILNRQISLVGQTPSLEAVQALAAWLTQLNQREIYFTNCLVRPYPESRPFKAVASGLLAVSVVLQQRAYHLIWFRPERIQTVNWAGDPHSAVIVDSAGEQRLSPRRSFALWKETVQEMALPWTAAEIDAALMMRNTLMLAVLEFSQVALTEAAERAAIANRAKSQFLAKMSHELRTPLNAILGFSQVMARSQNVPLELQETLEIISRSGEHLLTLINDVLEMSKIEAGQLTLTEKSFDLLQLVDSVLEMFALKAAEKGILLRLHRAEDLPQYLWGDEAKLRQILINLLSNAIKFTDQGQVVLHLWTKPQPGLAQATSRPTLRLYLEVEDTGCGIAPADLDSIFTAFMQAEQGRSASGTGLGLAISRQFAQLMEGNITARSTPNQGSTFTCTAVLSLPETGEVAVAPPHRQVTCLAPGQPTYRILVVEDVLENRQLLVTLLTSVGFEVRAVENGLDAIATWREWQPHLIFMDICLPELDGYATTQQIRELERQQSLREKGPTLDPTPIIALTAFAFDSDRARSLQAGCTDYIAKPFTETDLFEILALHLSVNYCYAAVAPLQPDVQSMKPLVPEDLAALPPAWVAQVHEAALDLNDAQLHQLIGQIQPQQPWLAGRLAHLVNNFQLEELVKLTQP